LKKWAPNFFVVDECHCFWEWGENFRPAFAKLPKWLEELEIDQSLWLSATLPFDAGRRLKSELPCLAIQGRFALPTKLRLHFEYVEWANRMEELIHWVRERSDLSGLIYVATREQAARISRTLELGLRIRPLLYHGGMSTEERQIVEMLLAEPSKKEPRIVIATSAFGLGMDFSQLKWVLLFQSPSSLLELTQVIGRVARAGQQGEATLFWSNDDFRLLDWKAKDSQRSVDELSKIEKFLRDADCRERGLLAYFNEEPGSFELPRCGRCDRCIVVDNAAAQK
jgi:ATP-dependent DNA helicase RecQ